MRLLCRDAAKHFSTRIMLKPIDDPHVDLVATVSMEILTLTTFVSLLYEIDSFAVVLYYTLCLIVKFEE